MRASNRTSLALLLLLAPFACVDDVPSGGTLDDDDGTSTGSPTTDPTNPTTDPTTPTTDPTVDPTTEGTTTTDGTTTDDPTVDPDGSDTTDGPACAGPEDCADLASECADATCEGGRCVVTDLEAGTPCGDASASECDGADACDGAGSCLPQTAPDGAACTECDGLECACAAGSCSECAAFADTNDFTTARSVIGWELTGDWGLYTEAPAAFGVGMFGKGPGGPPLPGIPFAGQVLGTDGNRSAPYPGGHAETSYARTKPFVLPATLDFQSWHLDEGGLSYDNKIIRVSTDGGKTWTIIHDCQSKISVGSAMCLEVSMREPDAWDAISLPVPAEMVGEVGIVELGYDTSDGCCDFERGWFIDVTSFATECACGGDEVCEGFGTDCGGGVCGASGACALDPIGEGMACGANASTSCGSADSCDAAGYCRDNDLVNTLTCEDCPTGEDCNGCLEGACIDCASPVDSFEAGIGQWSGSAVVGGGWSLFGQMPGNEAGDGPLTPTDVFFLGNDGSFLAPADGAGETTNASITSPVDVMPDTLVFDSWHVDEGGLDAVDNKRLEVSTDLGETWTVVADCTVPMLDEFAFCSQVMMRGADDWDTIMIDTSAFAGMAAQLRFSYETLDACCGFEYGWFIDDLNFAQLCPDPNPALPDGGKGP